MFYFLWPFFCVSVAILLCRVSFHAKMKMIRAQLRIFGVKKRTRGIYTQFVNSAPRLPGDARARCRVLGVWEFWGSKTV